MRKKTTMEKTMERFPKFFNRELSWIQFNRRVLEEAMDSSMPILDRLKFLCIVSSNFDEFFQVRVAYIKRQLLLGNQVNCPSGLRPSEQLERIHQEIKEILALQYKTLYEEILPGLAFHNIRFLKTKELDPAQLEYVSGLFEGEIFPVLTPIRVPVGSSFPALRNLRLYIAFRLQKQDHIPDGEEGNERIALVQVPTSIPRIIYLPTEKGKVAFTFLEDVILLTGGQLFPGYQVLESLLFRVARDADLGVDEERDDDFVDAMVEILEQRDQSPVVRFSYVKGSGKLRDYLAASLDIGPTDQYELPGPLDLASIMELTNLPGYEALREEPWNPLPSPHLPEDESYWSLLSHTDVLLLHPYESFNHVVQFLNQAAADPDVLSIKITLYRTSGSSPIVQALERAARNKKQVTALVELKARFDEERNIEWASRLEKAGVIVIYGIAHLKVHAKALFVIRREGNSVRRYAHLATGNFNEKTARIYTDIGLLTSRDDLTYELALFFNAVTGYSAIPNLRRLAMSPVGLKGKLLTLIEREIARTSKESPGLIMAKMNSLADKDMINALYQASKAGVQVLLNVRGICMLVPGLPGLSENITVVSIVDRFLEHSRVFYFHNGGSEEVYCSSGDWMNRNLELRIELMFPIDQRDLRERLIKMLKLCFKDNIKARILLPSGVYVRKKPAKGEASIRLQHVMHRETLELSKGGVKTEKREFQVRRKFPGE